MTEGAEEHVRGMPVFILKCVLPEIKAAVFFRDAMVDGPDDSLDVAPYLLDGVRMDFSPGELLCRMVGDLVVVFDPRNGIGDS